MLWSFVSLQLPYRINCFSHFTIQSGNGRSSYTRFPQKRLLWLSPIYRQHQPMNRHNLIEMKHDRKIPSLNSYVFVSFICNRINFNDCFQQVNINFQYAITIPFIFKVSIFTKLSKLHLYYR